MPLAVIGDKVLYFAHIPKCGGSSVEAYLRAKGRLFLVHTRPQPWSKTSPDQLDLTDARVILDGDHAHLTGIKERILEYLAEMEIEVRLLAPEARRPDDYLVDKHYLRKHGKDAYYGQGRPRGRRPRGDHRS